MKNIRKISTLLLTFSFIYLIISLIGMEISHAQRELENSGFLGQYAYIFKEIHMILGYFFLILLIFHTAINYKSILSHLKKAHASFRPSKAAVATTLISSVIFAIITGAAIYGGNEHKDKRHERIDTISVVSQK